MFVAHIQWLRLVKTNHDVNVRVSDKVDLEGLPQECYLMVVSNHWGLIIVASSTGEFTKKSTLIQISAYIACRTSINCWRSRRRMRVQCRNLYSVYHYLHGRCGYGKDLAE